MGKIKANNAKLIEAQTRSEIYHTYTMRGSKLRMKNARGRNPVLIG